MDSGGGHTWQSIVGILILVVVILLVHFSTVQGVYELCHAP